MSIRIKILLLFALLGIMPTVIIGVFYNMQSERSIQSKVLEMTVTTTQQTVSAINDRIDYIEKAVNTLVQNEVMLETLDELPRLEVVDRAFGERQIANYFSTAAFNNAYIKSIALVPLNGETTVYGEGTSYDSVTPEVKHFLNNDFRNDEWFAEMDGKVNEMQWFDVNIGEKRMICLVKNFSFLLFARQMGMVVAIMDENAFSSYETGEMGGANSLLITKDNLSLKTGKNVNFAAATSADATAVESNKDFTISARLRNGWQFANVISKSYLYEDIHRVRSNVLLFVAITSAAFIIMAVIASFSVGNRVSVILKKFARLQTGDFSVDTQLKGKDELSAIEVNYNKTVNRLEQLIGQNYIYKIEKRDAQLSALQYQINPHFLYNMLEVVNSMAAVHKAADIQEVTQRLGQMYRYNTSNGTGRPTLLEDELCHIENYIYLQNIQMSGRLQAYIDVPETLRKCHIIKFILQPVVENCIKHGFYGKTGYCCIEITAQQENGVLVLKIIDDGQGIDPVRICRIKNDIEDAFDIQEKSTSGIGLRNVNSRLHLKYGANFGLTINSSLGCGTTVTLTLPTKEYESEGIL